jgi:transcription initiation factor IIE alpha subunit
MSEAAIAFFAIGLNFAIVFLIIFLVFQYYNNIYETTKHKISDADIFKLMSRANHFITPEQLAAVSPLDLKEAKGRLINLSNKQIIRQYYNNGGIGAVYQLKEDIPILKELPTSLQGLSDQEIVDTILKYSPDYQITIAELVVIFGIEVKDAKTLLKRLRKAKLVNRLWSSKGTIYAINSPLQLPQPKLSVDAIVEQPLKMALHQPLEKIRIPDADILELAVKHKGKLTPTRLCLDMKISLEEAAEKLDSLHEKGIFTVDVHEENAIMEYYLLDKDLLE